MTTKSGRGRPQPDPADKAQLERSPVRWSRVAALFRPYRWQLAVVVALIVASSTVALATPFLVRLVIDEALPAQDVPLLLWAVGGMLAVTVVTAVFGVVQTWLSTTVGPAGHARPADGGLHAPAAAVARLLHPHPRRRGAVAAHQRHRRHAVGGHLDRDLGRRERHHGHRHGGRDGRAELAAVAALPRGAAAGHLADPPRGPDAAHGHRPAPAAPRRPALAGGGGAVDQRRPARQDPRGRAGAVAALRRHVRRPGRPRGPLPAGRALADGDDEHRVRRHPGADLPRRRAARDVGRDDHRHPGRLHRPPGGAVPAAHGPARPRRLAHQLDGAVQPGLRVPRPAGRHRRPGRAGARGPGARARRGPVRARRFPLSRRPRGPR